MADSLTNNNILNTHLASKIKALRSLEDFCSGQQKIAGHLTYHINHPIYYSMRIPKKKGGERLILAPNDNLKAIQSYINRHLQQVYLFYKPSTVHGFVKRVKPFPVCNIISNAKMHVGKNYVLNMDLADFFPNISAKQVKQCLCAQPINMPDNLANVITLLCTYQKQLQLGPQAHRYWPTCFVMKWTRP